MYYLARRNGRLVKVWQPDPTATEAIARAYVDVFGRPAPDNWRAGLAEIVTAARATPPQQARAAGTIASQIAASRAAGTGTASASRAAGTIASQIAAAILREQLVAGHRIEIPSLGISIGPEHLNEGPVQ
jgi:hypothetical protein